MGFSVLKLERSRCLGEALLVIEDWEVSHVDHLNLSTAMSSLLLDPISPESERPSSRVEMTTNSGKDVEKEEPVLTAVEMWTQEVRVEVYPKGRNRTAWWPTIVLFGYVPKAPTSTRHRHSHGYCCFIHSSQGTGTALMSIRRWLSLNEDYVVHIRNSLYRYLHFCLYKITFYRDIYKGSRLPQESGWNPKSSC